jgi:aerobic C4-dicarboxylate transport protein
MESLKKVGRVGGKAILYFEVITTLALILGMLVANIVQPGAGINADLASFDSGAVARIAQKAQPQTTMQFIVAIIPSSVVDAFAKNNLLQVLLFSMLFGISLSALGDRGQKAREVIDEFGKILLGKFGIGTLQQLSLLIVCYCATTLLFVALVLGSVARMAGISLWKLIKYLKEEMFICSAPQVPNRYCPS